MFADVPLKGEGDMPVKEVVPGWVSSEVQRIVSCACVGKSWYDDGSRRVLMTKRKDDKPRKLERRIRCRGGELKLTMTTLYETVDGKREFVVQAVIDVRWFEGPWFTNHPIRQLLTHMRLQAGGTSQIFSLVPNQPTKRYRARIIVPEGARDRSLTLVAAKTAS